jgi:hypothetical protein
MRLTREGELKWTVDHSPAPFEDLANRDLPDRLPTYASQYDNLKFKIEDASAQSIEHILPEEVSEARKKINPGRRYRIVIEDKKDSSRISSPPMKQLEDLVSVIKKKPKKDKLKDINERLSGM